MAGIIGVVGSDSGLMPSYNKIPNMPPCGGGIVTDLDLAHEKAGSGLSLVYATNGTSNKPTDDSAGVYLHIQRLGVGIVTVSQKISQLTMSNNSIYIRTGVGNGLSISWSDWKAL